MQTEDENRLVRMWFETGGVRQYYDTPRPAGMVKQFISRLGCPKVIWGYDEIEPITYPPTLASSPGTDSAPLVDGATT